MLGHLSCSFTSKSLLGTHTDTNLKREVPFTFLLNKNTLVLSNVLNCVYSTARDSMIDHCDRCITLLRDPDISYGLFNLFTYFDMPFGWYLQSICKRNFEDIFNRKKNISKSPRWVISLSQCFILLCLWLYVC